MLAPTDGVSERDKAVPDPWACSEETAWLDAGAPITAFPDKLEAVGAELGTNLGCGIKSVAGKGGGTCPGGSPGGNGGIPIGGGGKLAPGKGGNPGGTPGTTPGGGGGSGGGGGGGRSTGACIRQSSSMGKLL